jgi:hypothetical protein
VSRRGAAPRRRAGRGRASAGDRRRELFLDEYSFFEVPDPKLGGTVRSFYDSHHPVYAPLLARLRGIATEDEVSAALGTTWPEYHTYAKLDLPDEPEEHEVDAAMARLQELSCTDLTARVLGAAIAARDAGGEFVIRGGHRGGRELERTAPFRERLLRLYDLLASRIPAGRRTLVWDSGPVPTRFNVRAAELTAAILNTMIGWSARALTAADVKSRVQKRRR